MNLYTKFGVSILNGYGDIFDKNLERKKKEQIHERINRRRRIFNPTIQHVIENLYIKFEVSILKGCEDIFKEISGEKKKRTNIGKDK